MASEVLVKQVARPLESETEAPRLTPDTFPLAETLVPAVMLLEVDILALNPSIVFASIDTKEL